VDIAKVYRVTVIDANNKEYHATFKLTMRPVVETVPLNAKAASALAAAASAAAVPPDYSRIQVQWAAPIEEGQSQVIGQISPHLPTGATLNVQISTQPETPLRPAALMQFTNSSPPPATVYEVPVKNNSFTLQFPQPLSAGQTLTVQFVDANGNVVKELPPQTLRAAISVNGMSVSIQPPQLGSNTITGSLSRMPVPAVKPTVTNGVTTSYGNYPGIVVRWTDPVTRLWSQAAPTLGANPQQFLSVSDNGGFAVTLPSKLTAGQRVAIDVVAPPGRSFVTDDPSALHAEATVVTDVSLNTPTNSTSPMNEGTTVLTGNATPPPTGVPINIAVVRLREIASDSGPASHDTVRTCLTQDNLSVGNHGSLLPLTSSSSNTFLGSVDATTGAFKVTLAQALREGEWIQIVQVLPAGSRLVYSESSRCGSEPRKVTYPFDFFRTNLTFVAGVLLSNSSAGSTTNANFSQANQFYAFGADHAWRMPGYDCIEGKEWGNPDWGRCKAGENRWHSGSWPGVSTAFDARMTSIPVSTPSTAVSSTGATTSAGTSTLLTSQKVLRVETEAYLPWVLGHGAGEHPSGLFFAPLAKAGFDTVTGAAAASDVILPGGHVGTLNFQSAYNFVVYGGRVGDMTLSQSQSRAPEVEHYLDVTIGRYSNLQSYICHHASSSISALPGSSCAADYPSQFPSAIAAADSRKQLYRLDFEGLVRIPIPTTAIPFYLGFNANIAQHTVGAAYLDHGYAPPDDIRILLGTKIDIGSLLTGLNLGPH